MVTRRIWEIWIMQNQFVFKLLDIINREDHKYNAFENRIIYPFSITYWVSTISTWLFYVTSSIQAADGVKMRRTTCGILSYDYPLLITMQWFN